jgi:capsule polysaccharide export protein KpsC/LpsZ
VSHSQERRRMVIATNLKLARLPYLTRFLADSPRAVAGWGRKLSGRRAQRLARWLGRPLALLEDGFVLSVARSDPPLALLVDDTGVYYDATRPSGIESTIAAGAGPEQAARARRLMALWQSGAISKYNHSPEYPGPLPAPYVLVVDQTFGDLSVTLGMADRSSFRSMLDAALAENPASFVVVKVHPDVFSHARRGWLAPEYLDEYRARQPARITVIGSDCHAASLLRGASAVYTVTSLMGFEALLWGKPVRCFGMPFYAGWGLTADDLPPPVRRGAASLESVIHAALVSHARYLDPACGAVWQAEDAIAHVARARASLLSAQAEARAARLQAAFK